MTRRRIPRLFGGGPVTEAATLLSRPDLTAAQVALGGLQVGVQSPLAATDTLSAVVWADLTGQDFRPLTREAAMAVPAVARQRHLVCGVAARCPLVLVGPDDQPLPNQPRWLSQGVPPMSSFQRTLWTVDDLVFGPYAVWWTVRDGARNIQDAERVPTDEWEVDDDGLLLVNGRPADDQDVLVIPGPHEGILNFGAPALRRTVDNLDSAARAARNPAAYLELHYTGTEPLTTEQKEQLLDDWAAARRGDRGGVAFTGPNLEVKEHGTHEAALLIDGRNADAVDVSRLISSPAAMADATSAGASLTYETTEGRGLQFLDYGASLYMDAVTARLSMDDATPAGTRVAFDVTQAARFQALPGQGQEQ